jgi:molybdate transport system regulatory protein
MKAGNRTTGARLRIVIEPNIAIGPGAAAGRAMGMSYKRAWHLIDTMNVCFRAPLVEATRGGRAGGGARLTPLGEEVLARYRRMQAQAEAAIEADMAALRRVLAAPPNDL